MPKVEKIQTKRFIENKKKIVVIHSSSGSRMNIVCLQHWLIHPLLVPQTPVMNPLNLPQWLAASGSRKGKKNKHMHH